MTDLDSLPFDYPSEPTLNVTTRRRWQRNPNPDPVIANRNKARADVITRCDVIFNAQNDIQYNKTRYTILRYKDTSWGVNNIQYTARTIYNIIIYSIRE